MNRVHGCKVFSAALAVMLVGCSRSAASEAPAATQTPAPTAAATASPVPATASPAPVTPAPTTDPAALPYDEMRPVALYGTVPYGVMEGYFTVSRDGKWGLIRANGAEVLPCMAETPVSNCGSGGHWVWHVQNLGWEAFDAYDAQLEAAGEPTLCPGHGGSTLRFFYDLDAPGLDRTAIDPKGYKAYQSGDGPGSIVDIADEMWETYGDLLPVFYAHEEGEPGDPVYPSEPETATRGDGVPVIYHYVSREGWGMSPADVQLGGFFYDEALAPVQLTGGKWAYLGRDSQEPVTEAVYDPTYAIDPELAYAETPSTEPFYAAPLQNGYAAVRRGEGWGLLDASGAEVIPCGEAGVAWEGTTLWLKDEAGWHKAELPA